MASEKISQLPSATTSSGNDLYPLVQSGINKSITFLALSSAISSSIVSGINQLTGDVIAGPGTGSQSAVIVSVGGQSASAIASSVTAFSSATSSNTPSTIVKRDSSGNFSAGTITANIIGDVSGSAASFTGSLVGDVTRTQGATVIGTNVVDNSKLAQMPSNTIKGNNTGSTANALDLTVAQVNAILPVFSSSLNGLVPASGGGTTNFLRADGAWAVAGVGSVVSVGLSDGSTIPIYSISGSPVTSSGTLDFSLIVQAANQIFAGPVSGSSAEPTFRSLVSADIPNLSSTYVPQSEVGVALGVASLDASGKVPINQLPSVIMEYQGSWDPTTNTPALSDGTGTNGNVYYVSALDVGTVPGLTDPSMVNFQIGDIIIYTSAIGKWQLVTPAAGVRSVNGAQGAVTVNAINQLTGDVTTSAASSSQSKASTISAIQGTTVSGTTGSGNVVFSSAPTFTGTISGVSANFSSAISASNITGTNTGDVTLGTPNGLSLLGQVLSLGLASAGIPGALSGSDWSVFNSKQPAGAYLTAVTATSPLFSSGGTTPNITIQQANATQSGFLSNLDWIIFNNKLDKSAGNYITNPDAEINTTGWNLYNNSGNTVNATVVAQDITYTAVASGNAGNGINIDYIFHATQSYLTPLVTVLSPTHVTVAWYNGPTIANNPTATQLKAAWDAVSGAVALATATITGVASNRQYETGANITANGGDTSPINGTGGTPSGVTFTRNTSTPLVGIASFDLGKIAANEQGQGVSTDFVISSVDKGNKIQISFSYEGSSGMVLGSNSDVRIFVYDITNATLIPVKSTGASLPGPVSTPKVFTGQFLSNSTSVNYRLIFHISTVSAVAWDLLLDSVTVSGVLIATPQTQVPSLVLPSQPISGAVTDHMVVMWRDGDALWSPATIAGAALPVFGDDKTQLGFATNIVGLTADIFIRGFMDGFSFGPFVNFEQYIDNVAGGISPLPSPFNDMYVMVGMAISSTVLNIQFDTHVDLIANASGVPLKGGLLTNSAANDGTGDQVLVAGVNGAVPFYNSAATLGIQTGPAVVVGSPFTYTTATRTLSISSQTQNTFLAAPNGSSGVPTFRAIVAADIPTLNQNTTGSAAKLTTARTIAGNSFDGSANITFSNKFIVQGTADAGLTAAQFLGALGTGIIKNTTTTGVLSIAIAADFPTLNQSTTGTASNITGIVALVNGGTGVAAASANAAFNALSPMTTLGDMEYEDATPKAVRLPGNTTAVKNFLTQTGNGTISAAPVWSTLASGDVSNASTVTGTTVTDALNTLNNQAEEILLVAYNSGTVVTANTTIPTWTTVKDTNSAFVASTGIFTVPVDGDYTVNLNLQATISIFIATVYKNGVAQADNTSSTTEAAITTVVPNCVVGDTITIQISQSRTLTTSTIDTVLCIWKLASASATGSAGLFAFGGGSDGALTVTTNNLTSGPLTAGTLTRDAYFTNLTISGSGAIKTGAFRIFVSNTLDITAASAGAISFNGNNGGNGAASATAGAAGAAVAAGTIGGNTAGIIGGVGGTAAGTQGAASTAASPGEGGASGASGAGGAGSGGAGGALRAATAVTNGTPFVRYATDLLRGLSIYQGGTGGPGGSGGGGDGTAGGGGGGGGAGGGIVYLSARTINRGGSTAVGTIEAVGGTGGNGGTAAAGTRGGGGGGAGGGGGWIYLIYNNLAGTSGTNILSASGGTGGNGGNGTQVGVSGGTGGNGGSGGRISIFNLVTGIGTDTFGSAGSAATAASSSAGTTGGAGNTNTVSL